MPVSWRNPGQNSMRNPPLIFLFLLLLAQLAACAGPQLRTEPTAAAPVAEVPATEAVDTTAPVAAASKPATDESEPSPELPSVALSGELLYQILAAEMALQRRHYDAGITHYLQLAESTRDPRLAERAAQAALFAHDDPRALRASRLWSELQPDRSEPHQMLVVAAIRNGLLEEALEHMDVLLSSPDGLPEERFELLAGLLSREHDVHESFRLMERFVASRRDNPSALYAYAHLAMRAGELEKARAAVDEVLAQRPGWHNAVTLRVRILLLADGPDAAMAYLAEAVRENPEDDELRVAYARALTDARRYQEAIDQYAVLAERVSPNTDVLLAMGMLYLQMERIDEAEELLLQVRGSGVEGADLSFYLGWIAEKRGDNSQAIAYYAALQPEAENYLEARLRIAILTAGEGDIPGARRQLQMLRMDDPAQQRRLYMIEGELLSQAGMPETGMEVLTAALQAFPVDFELLYSRALLAEAAGRLDVLEQDLRLILEHEPAHVDALNALGYTLADRTDRYREAYDYISRALELNPDNNAILDSMGWVLYRLGNYDEAIQYLQRSLSLKHDHEVAAHLGEVLWVSGDQDAAMAVWKRALEAFPDKEILRETMQRFIR